MRKIFNRRNIILCLLAIVISPAIWWYSGPVRGRLMAHYDIARGQYRILFYGLPMFGFSEYRQLLHDRYSVELLARGCVVTDAPYVNAYDKVVTDAVNRKFGRDIFRESWQEAQLRFHEKQKAEIQNVSRSE